MLKINCSKCSKELKKPGALVFSPPDVWGICFKTHLCHTCYELVLKFIQGVKNV
jgi:hypothetical protein